MEPIPIYPKTIIKMATSHMQLTDPLSTSKSNMMMTENVPEKPRIPLVAHVITDDDIGLLQVCNFELFIKNRCDMRSERYISYS